MGWSSFHRASRARDIGGGMDYLPPRCIAAAVRPAQETSSRLLRNPGLTVTQPKDKALLKLDPAQNFLLGNLVLSKRLRDIAINNATHEAAAVAEKSNELTRIRLANQSFDTLALSDKPTRIAADSARNLALIALKRELRFANLGVAPPALYAKCQMGSDTIY